MAGKSKLRQFFSSSFGEFILLLTIVILIRTFGFGLYQVPTGSMETTILAGERFFADKLTIIFSGPERGEIIAFNDPYYTYSTNSFMRNVVEEYFWGPSNWTKRVIGVPGDKVRGVIEEGKPVIYLNDVKLMEPYLNQYPLLYVFSDASHSHFNPVSYDPSKPFNNQPFYKINPADIVYEMGQMAIRMPQTPLPPRPELAQRQGNNFWNGTDEFYVELGAHQYWVLGDNREGSQDSRFWGPLDGKHIHGRILYRIWSIDSRAWLWVFDLMAHPFEFWSRVRWSRFFQRVS